MKELESTNAAKPLEELQSGDEKSTFDFSLSNRWLTGIPYEVAFWRSYYRSRRSREKLLSWSQYGKECQLDKFDVSSFIDGLDRKDPIIADVGCALSYMFSDIIGGMKRNVFYIDPLAPHYNKILDDYTLPYPRITFGMGETLSLHLPADGVSFIHIRNALDHSVRPMSTLWQALMCLHTGGKLYLNHKPNEAEHEAYMGFHQYNVDCQDGRLIIWNKVERVDVGNELHGYADVESTVTDEGRIVGVITKLSEIPSTHPGVKESAMYASGMMETMMTYFHTLNHDIDYQLRWGALTIGHGIMRMIPGGMIRKFKHLITGQKPKM